MNYSIYSFLLIVHNIDDYFNGKIVVCIGMHRHIYKGGEGSVPLS